MKKKLEEEALEKNGSKSDWVKKETGDGKVYYFNEKLNKILWSLPPDLIEEEGSGQNDKSENQEGSGSGAIKLSINLSSKIDSTMEKETERPIRKEVKKEKTLSKEEARTIFINLLKEKKVNPAWKWPQVHKCIRNDDRYLVVPRVSDKKKLFGEYVSMTKRAERTAAKNKMEQARQAYLEMLKEYESINSDSKYAHCVQFFYQDPRYKEVEEKDRENLFQDYLDSLYQKEVESDKRYRREMISKMREHFEELTFINTSTTWEEVNELLKFNGVWQKLNDLDKLE